MRIVHRKWDGITVFLIYFRLCNDPGDRQPTSQNSKKMKKIFPIKLELGCIFHRKYDEVSVFFLSISGCVTTLVIGSLSRTIKNMYRPFSHAWPLICHERSFKVKGHDALLLIGQCGTFFIPGTLVL